MLKQGKAKDKLMPLIVVTYVVSKRGRIMSKKVMSVLEEMTGGKSYRAHKYGLDNNERPSIDYTEDNIIWQETAETKRNRNYVPLWDESKKVLTSGTNILSFFLDGSRRVFKVDDMGFVLPGGRNVIFPVIAGQIGIGCTRRENRVLKQEKFYQEFVLSMPDIANADGKAGYFPALAQKLNSCQSLKNANIEFSTILEYKTAKNYETKYEDKGTALVQERMSIREREMVAELVREGKLDQDNYLIKDGSLEYRPTKQDRADEKKYQQFRNNYNFVLGVSKNFNPEVCKDINGKSNPGYVADLPLYHRTPVACFKNTDLFGDVKFAVWYIRIRDTTKTRTAFDGIVKVEKMLITHEENEYGIDSELVDLLSASIINERNPVCYGSDLRWANHLYPVYLTETYVKSRYLSADSFLHLF